MSGDASRSSRRQLMDFMKLKNSSRRVYPSDTVSEFWVEFTGPEGTAYEEGTWMMHVVLPNEYPFKSPSIGFANRILHPNVDEESGSVCLDVINQKWTPMFELQNIFDIFLPQLLRYPNPDDPLNPNAAAHLQRDPVNYYSVLQAHVARYATLECALAAIPESFRPQNTAAAAAAAETSTSAATPTATTTTEDDVTASAAATGYRSRDDGVAAAAYAAAAAAASEGDVKMPHQHCGNGNGNSSSTASSSSRRSNDSAVGNGRAEWSASNGVTGGGLTMTATADEDDEACRNDAQPVGDDNDADNYEPDEIEL